LIVFDIDGTLVQYHRKRNDAAYIRAVKDTLGIALEDSWTGFKSSTDSGILDEVAVMHLGRPCFPAEVEAVKARLEAYLPEEYGPEPFRRPPAPARSGTP
jgi:hypothetical protein